MKQINLKLFTAARAALEQERAALLARIQVIKAALSGAAPAPAIEVQPEIPRAPRPKRKMSAAGRAAVAAGARARWAKLKAAKAPAAATAMKVGKPPPKATRMDNGEFCVGEPPVPGIFVGPILSTECKYCLRTIRVHVEAPQCQTPNGEKKALELAIVEHLRTDHLEDQRRKHTS